MTEKEERLLRAYAQAVVNSPPSLHLTADKDPELFWKRHVLDAMAILEKLPKETTDGATNILDVGSGNGVPGIPLAICRPNWAVTLLDSDNKKCGFLELFLSINAVKNTKIVCARAEDASRTAIRSSFDLVFARAFHKLLVTLELASAFVKTGGYLIVPHGTSWKSQTSDSTVKVLGLSGPSVINYRLGDISLALLIYRKERETPSEYPRKRGIPEKRPLK